MYRVGQMRGKKKCDVSIEQLQRILDLSHFKFYHLRS